MNELQQRSLVLADALEVLVTKLRDPDIGPCLLLIDEETLVHFASETKQLLEVIQRNGLPKDFDLVEKELWPDVISEL